MFNAAENYCNKDGDIEKQQLEFNYLNLEKYLYELHKQGIYDINLFLYVSPENPNYHGEHLKKVVVDLKN